MTGGGSKVVKTLWVELRGKTDRFTTEMKKASDQFGKSTEKFRQTGMQLGKSLAVPLAAVGAAAFAAGLKVDDAFDKIRLTSGKTGGELEKLQDSFKNVFKSAPASAEEVAGAMGALSTRTGKTGQDLEALTTQFLALSRVTGTDVTVAVDKATRLFGDFSVKAEDQSRVLDLVYAASQKAGISFDSLADTMVQFGAPFRTAGFSIEQSAAMLAKWQKEGVNTELVAGSMRIALNKMAEGGVKNIPAEFQKVIKTLKNMKEEAARALAGEIFGKKAGLDILDTIRAGKMGADDMAASIRNTSGAIQAAAKDTDGFSEKLQKLNNRLTASLGENVGMPMLDGLSAALDEAEPKIDSFISSLQETPRWAQELGLGLAGVTAGFIGISAAMTGVTAAFSTVTGGLITFNGLIAAATGLVYAFLTPWGLIAGAVGLGIAALYDWDATCNAAKVAMEYVNGIAKSLTDTLGNLAGAIGDRLNSALTGVTSGIMDMGKKMGDTLTNVADAMMNKLGMANKKVLEGTKQTTEGIVGHWNRTETNLIHHSPIPDIADAISSLGKNMPGSVVPGAQKATEGVYGAFDWLEKGTHKKVEKIKEHASELKDIMRDVDDVLEDQGVMPKTKLTLDLEVLLEQGDRNGIEALAKKFDTSRESVDEFQDSFRKAVRTVNESKFVAKDFERFKKGINGSFSDIFGGSAKPGTTSSPLAQDLLGSMLGGDKNSFDQLVEANAESQEEMQELSEALQEAREAYEQMTDAQLQLGQTFAGAFSNMGMGGGASNAFGSFFGDMIGGMGDSWGASIGNSINKFFGGSGENGLFGEWGKNFDGWDEALKAATDVFKIWNDDKLDKKEKMLATRSAVGRQVANYFIPGLGEAVTAIKSINPEFFEKMSANFSLSDRLIQSLTGEHPDLTARKGVERWIESLLQNKRVSMIGANGQIQPWDGNIRRGDSSRFNDPAWGDNAVNQYGAEAMKTFNGLGEAFKRMAGVTEDVGAQMGVILADSLAGNIDNARLLVQQMGVSLEQLEAQLVTAGINGEMSWLEVESALQGVHAAFGEGRAAIADMTGAMEAFSGSGGRGMDSIKAVRDMAIEAMEGGARSIEDLRNRMIAAGKWAPEAINMFMQALAQRQITSLDQLASASDRTAGGVVADMTALGFQFAEVASEADKIVQALTDMPDNAEKNVHFNVTSSLDSNTQALVNGGQLTDLQTTEPKKFAKGGIVNGPMLFNGGAGLMGEAGAEAIMPLKRGPNGRLGISMYAPQNGRNGGGAPVTIQIDARGAEPGVERSILNAIEYAKHEAVQMAVDVIAESINRGGGFNFEG